MNWILLLALGVVIGAAGRFLHPGREQRSARTSLMANERRELDVQRRRGRCHGLTEMLNEVASTNDGSRAGREG